MPKIILGGQKLTLGSRKLRFDPELLFMDSWLGSGGLNLSQRPPDVDLVGNGWDVASLGVPAELDGAGRVLKTGLSNNAQSSDIVSTDLLRPPQILRLKDFYWLQPGSGAVGLTTSLWWRGSFSDGGLRARLTRNTFFGLVEHSLTLFEGPTVLDTVVYTWLEGVKHWLTVTDDGYDVAVKLCAVSEDNVVAQVSGASTVNQGNKNISMQMRAWSVLNAYTLVYDDRLEVEG